MRSGAQVAHRTLKVNYNTVCDLERFEKFKTVVQNISSAKKLAKLFATVIKEVPSIIPCSVCCIFVITPNLVLNRQLIDYELILQKSVIDGKFIDVVGLSDASMLEP